MLHGGTTEFNGDCNRIRDGGDGPGTDTLPNRSATRSRVIWALSHIIPHFSEEVYPRVGGGASDSVWLALGLDGLSPRGRGSQAQRAAAALPKGSIPAWAGEPMRLLARAIQMRVYPRVGGGARWRTGPAMK